jgi:predicted porin
LANGWLTFLQQDKPIHYYNVETLMKLKAAYCGLFASFALAALEVPAQAADLTGPGGNDFKLPTIPALTWGPLTVYGAIDVALQYQTHGVPISGSVYSTPGFITPPGRQSQLVVAPNQSVPSFVGFKIDQPIAQDLNFIAKAESGFVPTTLRLDDALKSLQKQNGVPLAQQESSFDGPRAGQVFNGQAYAGLSSSRFGTLTYGRQYTPLLDEFLRNDPLASYAFSPLGFYGSYSGQGSSETTFIDSSLKYSNKLGPVRLSAFYANPGTSVNNIWQISGGVDWQSFSIDVVGGRATDQIAAAALSAATLAANPTATSMLGAKVFDTSMFGLFGKWDLGRSDLFKGSKLLSKATLHAGYEHIDFKNPSNGGISPGHKTIGGYEIGPVVTTIGSPAAGIVNNGFTGGDRHVDMAYVGFRYQISPQWTAGAAYYRFHQNSFGFGVNSPAYSKVHCSSTAFANCAGWQDVVGARVEYQANKNFTIYGGAAFSEVHAGMRAGFLHGSQFDPTIGARFMF